MIGGIFDPAENESNVSPPFLPRPQPDCNFFELTSVSARTVLQRMCEVEIIVAGHGCAFVEGRVHLDRGPRACDNMLDALGKSGRYTWAAGNH